MNENTLRIGLVFSKSFPAAVISNRINLEIEEAVAGLGKYLNYKHAEEIYNLIKEESYSQRQENSSFIISQIEDAIIYVNEDSQWNRIKVKINGVLLEGIEKQAWIVKHYLILNF